MQRKRKSPSNGSSAQITDLLTFNSNSVGDTSALQPREKKLHVLEHMDTSPLTLPLPQLGEWETAINLNWDLLSSLGYDRNELSLPNYVSNPSVFSLLKQYQVSLLHYKMPPL